MSEDQPTPPPEPPTYVYDPTRVPDVAKAIDRACEVAGATIFSLGYEVARILQLTDDDLLARELHNLFHHHLQINSGSTKSGAEMAFVRPTNPSSPYPIAIMQASGPAVDLWRSLGEAVEHPLARAFLNDVLFNRREGKSGLHAQRAMTSYIEASAVSSLDTSTRSEAAMRAWTLSRQTKSVDVELATRRAIVGLALEDLDGENHQLPGLTLPLLAALTYQPRALGPESFDLDGVLDKAVLAYGNADHIDFIAELILQTTNGKVRGPDLRRMRVQARIDRATDAEIGHLKMHWFEEAARLATQLGIADLSVEATTAMQQIDPASLEWISIPFDPSPPDHAIESYVRNLLRHNDWRVGLALWLDTGPPSGSYESNVQITTASLRGLIFHTLMPTSTYGAHGLPQSSGSPDAESDAQVRRTERMQVLTHGVLLAEALRRIGSLHTADATQDIEIFLRSQYRCHERDAYILSRTLRLYWRGDFIEAAHLITPFVEAGARKLLLLLNEPIYKVEQGRKIGQFVGLGSLLPRLADEGFDYDWIRFLETMLLPTGINFRNVIAHGFTYGIDPVNAALLIRAAALFMVMPNLSETERPSVLPKHVLPRTSHRTLRHRAIAAMSAARWAFHN